MFINGANSKAIDEGSANNSDSLVTQSTPTKYSQQLWRLKDLFNGYYLIVNESSGDALDNFNSVQNGSKIGHKTPDTLHAQQWQILPVKTGYFKIINRVSGKVLDNLDNSLNDGTAIIQLSDQSSTNTNQQWKLEVTDIVAVKQNRYNKSEKLLNSKITDNNSEYFLFNLRGRKITSTKSTSFQQFKHNCNLPTGTYLVIQKRGNIKNSHQILLQ
jgi:hypothetical protein